jgi:hypothetical protein
MPELLAAAWLGKKDARHTRQPKFSICCGRFLAKGDFAAGPFCPGEAFRGESGRSHEHTHNHYLIIS